MALMERIVRPHVPVDTGPSKQTTKCQEEPKNQVIKFDAPTGITGYKPLGGGFTTKDPPKVNTQQKTKNSSSSYAYKKYMTKVEKEQDKCDSASGGGDARIVGGQVADPKKADAYDPTHGGTTGGVGSPPGAGGIGSA